jgi:hypothetical protein
LQCNGTFTFCWRINARRQMLDSHLQERFARRCTDAAFGYSAATTAAYAAFADQVLGFWAGVLTPSEDKPRRRAETTVWGWPMPQAPAQLPPLPFMAFTPFGFGWPDAHRQSAFPQFPTSVYGPFAAWLNMFPMAAPSAAWPMAFMMMASGVPRSVAWPTAEANAAVMDAADAAAASVRKVYASYRTDGGHSTGRDTWPSAQLFAIAAFLPLTIGSMMSALRVG